MTQLNIKHPQKQTVSVVELTAVPNNGRFSLMGSQRVPFQPSQGELQQGIRVLLRSAIPHLISIQADCARRFRMRCSNNVVTMWCSVKASMSQAWS